MLGTMRDEEHRAGPKGKAFSDYCIEANPNVGYMAMGLDGLKGFEEPFKPMLADVKKAKQEAQLIACTRMRVEDVTPSTSSSTTEDNLSMIFSVLSPFGRPITNLDYFPFWRSEVRGAESCKPSDYGCCVAISLYLRFNVHFALLMVLCFVLSLPQVKRYLMLVSAARWNDVWTVVPKMSPAARAK